ncbi:hypothetical protein [Pseudanabaena sp. FACHB-2040]|uniref:hypothetical protein n=1 Tax=Pseudanabaena sp. FACHB-2040 TaxID=2692859 RepID=UPI001689589C|nr:hypothetical protein [Pseudanabaena sp. FACHB-2040]MBD2258555.1 hypothetical protein [Pseudanabaena sp. FACHB-2040]
MAQNAAVLQAVERLGYRVTVGDVAAEAGLPLNVAQQGVLALASDVQAHLQVSEVGEIAYQFPRNARTILLSKSWRLRLQETWNRIWRVLFYLIRISFGILLILSLVLIAVAIFALVMAAQSSQQGDNRNDRRGGGGFIFMPRIWLGNPFYLFDFNYGYGRQRRPREKSEFNFLEAIFSFLFGDGDPNADLEDRRWQTIAAVIRNNRGAVVAEQIAPYLDTLGQGWSREYEDFMLPVLSRFNGQPEVSPQGQLVYHFPELQVTADNRRSISVPQFLQELPRRFSQATSGQIMMAIGLGSANLIGALVLGNLLQDQVLVAELGGLVAFASSIYWLLLGYGAAFLGLPLVRYFWVQQQNRKIDARNSRREEHAIALAATDSTLQEKLSFARQFAAQAIITQDNLAYTTEQDLIEQEAANPDKVDEEWRRRLRESNP